MIQKVQLPSLTATDQVRKTSQPDHNHLTTTDIMSVHGRQESLTLVCFAVSLAVAAVVVAVVLLFDPSVDGIAAVGCLVRSQMVVVVVVVVAAVVVVVVSLVSSAACVVGVVLAC